MIGGSQRRLTREEYRLLKQAILDRDGWRCQSCGRREQLEVHHQIRRSQLGPDVEENLIVLCSLCHRALHEGADETGTFVEEW